MSPAELSILENVPGAVVVLRVGSLSGSADSRIVTLEYDQDGRLRTARCDCPGFTYRATCHHVRAVWDLAGGVPP